MDTLGAVYGGAMGRLPVRGIPCEAFPLYLESSPVLGITLARGIAFLCLGSSLCREEFPPRPPLPPSWSRVPVGGGRHPPAGIASLLLRIVS